VWDRLHGFAEPSRLADVDLVFFDADDLSPDRDREVEEALRARAPELPWQAKNQAAVHLWYPRKFGVDVAPLRSSAQAVATWPETATAVALHLDRADRLTVVAPCGLDDLFALVHRRNPRRVSVREYERRLARKRISERWPRVTVIPAHAPLDWASPAVSRRVEEAPADEPDGEREEGGMDDGVTFPADR
jgi:uncharacterized protein